MGGHTPRSCGDRARGFSGFSGFDGFGELGTPCCERARAFARLCLLPPVFRHVIGISRVFVSAAVPLFPANPGVFRLRPRPQKCARYGGFAAGRRRSCLIVVSVSLPCLRIYEWTLWASHYHAYLLGGIMCEGSCSDRASDEPVSDMAWTCRLLTVVCDVHWIMCEAAIAMCVWRMCGRTRAARTTPHICPRAHATHSVAHRDGGARRGRA